MKLLQEKFNRDGNCCLSNKTFDYHGGKNPEDRHQDDYTDELICFNCKSDNIITDYQNGSLVCNECGMVLELRMIDRGQDWRAFDRQEENDRAHCEPFNFSLDWRSTLTRRKQPGFDGRHQPLSPEQREKFQRLSKTEARVQYHKHLRTNNGLQKAFTLIEKIGIDLSLPRTIIEEAKSLFDGIKKKHDLRGRSINLLALGCLERACRRHEIMVENVEWDQHVQDFTFNDWINAGKDVQDLISSNRKSSYQMVRDSPAKNESGTRSQQQCQDDLPRRNIFFQKQYLQILKDCNRLKFNPSVIKRSRCILEELSRRGRTSGLRVRVISAVVILLALEDLNEPISLKEASRQFNVSRNVLSQWKRKFRRVLEEGN